MSEIIAPKISEWFYREMTKAYNNGRLHAAAHRAVGAIYALKENPNDPRVIEAYRIFHDAMERMKAKEGLWKYLRIIDPYHKLLTFHAEHVDELAIKNFGNKRPEDAQPPLEQRV